MWRTPAFLIGLTLVPVIAGLARLASLAAGGAVTDENARFFASPGPVAIHIVAVTLYCVLGAFQFSGGIRRRWPTWHRRAGQVLLVAGLAAAASGLWMTHFSALPRPLQGPWLYSVRWVVALAMGASLVLGWRSIVQRQVAQHEAWMMRAYALGQGAGTQALLLGPWMLLVGPASGATYEGLMTLAWVINAAVAEVLIARRAPRPVHAV